MRPASQIRLVVWRYKVGIYFFPSPMPKETPLLTIKISGKGLRSGHIPVPLLVTICAEAQRAVNRQAEALAGKRSLRPGRHTAEVRDECTLDLVALKKGSTTLQFVPASEQHSLLGIGLDAVMGVAEALQSVSHRRYRGEPPDAGVLSALSGLGEVFRPEVGVEKLQWIVPAHGGTRRKKVEFNQTLHSKLRERIQPLLSSSVTAVEPSALEGTLELTEGKGRIVPPVGSPTLFNFGSDQAVAVLEATKKPVKITVDPKTHKLENLEVASAPIIDGNRRFFVSKTIDQLIAEQGIRPIEDLKSLAGAIPDEDVDDFLADIYRERGA